MAKAKTKAERDKRDAKIRQLSKQGKGRGEIARRMEVSYDTVRLVLDPEYREAQRARKTSEYKRTRVSNSLGQWLIKDDGIIDDVAVAIAVAGLRKVRLTWPEREAAARKLIAGGTDMGTLKDNLGMNAKDTRELMDRLGIRLGKGWHKHSGPSALVYKVAQSPSSSKTKCANGKPPSPRHTGFPLPSSDSM